MAAETVFAVITDTILYKTSVTATGVPECVTSNGRRLGHPVCKWSEYTPGPFVMD